MDSVPDLEPIDRTEHLNNDAMSMPVAKHRIDFPIYVVCLGVVTLVAFVFGLMRLPHAIGSGINFSKGTKANLANQPLLAIQKLKPIVDEYEEADEVRVELLRAYVLAGDLKNAKAQMGFFRGRKISHEINSQLDEIDVMAQSKFAGVPK